ncbi:MAG: heme exporter protein CcmB [Ilumatobacteraceae bacterium]
MLRIARLVAGKDLRVEWRARVLLSQVVPVAGLVLVLFAFALDNGGVVHQGDVREPVTTFVAPGLLWLATLLSLLLLVQRAFAVESADGALDALRVAGVRAEGIFLGKAAALFVELLMLEAALTLGIVVFYDTRLRAAGLLLLVATLLTATAGLALVGTLYGGLTAGAKGRETLLPLLVFPVVSPVLLGAARATEAALGTGGAAVTEGWPWVGLLTVFAAAFGVAGTVAFGPLLEE